MLKDFKENVRQTLQRHDVQDEKLEAVLSDMFSEFEKHILSRDFVERITREQNRLRDRARRAQGRI